MLENILALFTSLISLITPFSYISPAPAPPMDFPGDVIELDSYRIYLAQVEGNNVSLIPNYTQQLSSSALIPKYGCKIGINGGFYDTNNNPLGLLVVNNKRLSEISSSKLFNGYVMSDATAFKLSPIKNIKSLAFDKVDFAFQTGPYLQRDVPSRLDDAKHARRMLIMQNNLGEIYLAAIVGTENNFSGPALAELHNIIFEQLSKYKFSSAINLDGGSASTFYMDGFHLPEFSPISALLCIK